MNVEYRCTGLFATQRIGCYLFSGPTGGPPGRATNNVYTVLALIAAAVLLFGIAFIWYYSHRLFGTTHPLEVTLAPLARLAGAGLV